MQSPAVTSPSYPAARQVASIVQDHFARHIAVARGQGRLDLGVEPDAESIEAIIDTAFWASLRREEGATPTISLALLPPGHAGQALTFNFQADLQGTAVPVTYVATVDSNSSMKGTIDIGGAASGTFTGKKQ